MTEVERGVESDGTEDYWSDEDDERMLQVDDECVLPFDLPSRSPSQY